MKHVPLIFLALAGGIVGDIEEVKKDYRRELRKLEEEHRKNVEALNERFAKIAEREKNRATKRGDLEEAVAWNEWAEELEVDTSVIARRLVGTRNLAPKAKLIASANESNPATLMTDGKLADLDDVKAHRRQYWVSPTKPAEVTFRFERPISVAAIRMAVPDREMHGEGSGIPTDYKIECYRGAAKIAEIEVENGKHHLAKPINERGWEEQGLWVTTLLPKPVICQEVRFICSRSSGQNRSPLIYEFEILGR